MRILQPPGWPKPKGYANGIETSGGRLVFVAGQIGWDTTETLAKSFTEQFRQALVNTVTVLAEADATPEHIVRMTWFITSRDDYLSALRPVGHAYREIVGRHYPAMSVVEVSGLMEADAKVEIETTAVVPTA